MEKQGEGKKEKNGERETRREGEWGRREKERKTEN